MNSDSYTCKYVILGKYTDGADYSFELEAAQALAKAFSLWCDLESFDPESYWLRIKISYVSDIVFSPELLATIKFFALFHDFSVMEWKDETRPLENGQAAN